MAKKDIEFQPIDDDPPPRGTPRSAPSHAPDRATDAAIPPTMHGVPTASWTSAPPVGPRPAPAVPSPPLSWAQLDTHDTPAPGARAPTVSSVHARDAAASGSSIDWEPIDDPTGASLHPGRRQLFNLGGGPSAVADAIGRAIQVSRDDIGLRVTVLDPNAKVSVGGRPVVPGGDIRIPLGPDQQVPIQVDANQVMAFAADADRVVFRAPAPHVAPGARVELVAQKLVLEVRDEKTGQPKRIVDEVSFVASPGELIAVMGDSGCGKSSLFSLISGYRRPELLSSGGGSPGRVLINGRDLHHEQHLIRGVIGLVPQDDLVHPELTVREAISYAAELRLPHLSAERRAARVEQIIDELNLRRQADVRVGNPEKRGISGGQRKRVNIALELVADPPVLLLDEPTSGLAASDTMELIDLLQSMVKRQGKTILAIIHQPPRREYEKFSRVIVLGAGGRLVYEGTPRGSYDFFNDASRRLGVSIQVDDPATIFVPAMRRKADHERVGMTQWQAIDQTALEIREHFEVAWEPTHPAGRGAAVRDNLQPPPLGSAIGQFLTLLRRYALVKSRDRAGLFMLGFQPVIIGVLLAAVFSDREPVLLHWCQHRLAQLGDLSYLQQVPRAIDPSVAAFFLAVSAIWCGTSNAAQEIVSEQAIYRRESMAGQSRTAYLASKFVLLAGVALIQCVIMVLIAAPVIGLGRGDPASIAEMVLATSVTAVCATAIGLTVSAGFRTKDPAIATIPILLIPQVVLGGLLIRLSELVRWKVALKYLTMSMPSHWAFRWVLGIDRSSRRWQLANNGTGWALPTRLSSGESVRSRGGGENYFLCAVEEFRAGAVSSCAPAPGQTTCPPASGDGLQLHGFGFGPADAWYESALWLGGVTAAFLVASWLLLRRKERRWLAGH